jgi:hypothetical protein
MSQQLLLPLRKFDNAFCVAMECLSHAKRFIMTFDEPPGSVVLKFVMNSGREDLKDAYYQPISP